MNQGGIILNPSIYVKWSNQNIKLTWLPNFIPEQHLVTSSHGFCFYQGKILLVNISGRGYTNPGGHLEDNETPEEAFIREAYEEAYVRGNTYFLGAIEVNHEENPLFDTNGKYPLIGYQTYFRMDITDCLPFLSENESSSRIWVEPSLIKYVINDHDLVLNILEEAQLR